MNVRIVTVGKENFAKELVDSLRDTGFAIIRGHHIYPGLIKETYNYWSYFFSQPLEEKMKLLYSKETQGGYFPMKSEKAKDAKVADLKEFYHWYEHLENQKPFGIENCTAWLRYDLVGVALELLRNIETELTARDVHMNSSEPLSSMVQDSNQTLFRIIHYPPVNLSECEEGATRAEAHEDINLITLLPAATNSGLQVKDVNGEWHAIHTNSDMIVVNVGDMLAEVTGGYLKSTTHRVIVDETATKESRYSMPLFLHPRSEVRLSERYTAGEYLTERLKQLGLL